MFQLDVFGNLSPLGIYLVRPNNEILGSLDNIIDETSSSLSVGLNKQYSIQFDIRHISGDQDWFDYVQEGMYLFVEGFGLFKIDQPSSVLDGVKEQKTVTAHGCDSELENSTCLLDINMGLETSMEYLVEYDDEETESLLNPYTGVPYDWIVLYNTFPEQLVIEANKLSDGYYGTADLSGDITVSDPELIDELTSLFSLIPRLKSSIIFSDNEDGSQDSILTEYVITNRDVNDYETIVSYTLKSSYADRIQTLISFYIKYGKQLSLLLIVLENAGNNWTIGDIHGLSDGDFSLANTKCQFEINETIYSFLTQKLSAATDCVVSFDIVNRRVNVTPVDKIGEYTGIFMGYDTLVNSLNIDTQEDRLATRLLVSGGDGLDIARVNFGSNYVDDLSYKMNVKSNGERIYVDDALAQKYANYIDYREQQRERYIQLSKDYEEYASQISEIENKLPNDYLYVDWSTYTSEELQAMLTNIKNLLVSLVSLYKENYGDIGLNIDGSVDEDYIKDTPYWWDYVSYNSIIEQLECAIAVYPYYNDQEQWTDAQISQFKDAISAWETEWTLFGVVELRAKIDTYKQNMDLLSQESVIRVSNDSYAIKTWAQLTESEKAEYGNNSALYRYDTYMEYYMNMLSAQDYLDSLLLQEDSLKLAQDEVQEERVSIVDDVSLESYFTREECKIIYKMFRDSSYSNENIISTSIDTTSESIDAMYELLLDAQEQVSITSRPQLTFSIEADNLLANPDLSPLWSSFVPGNYMLIEYKDGTYVRLRMTGYSFNPCMPSSNDLKVEFSNFIRSKSDYNDWASLLGTSSGATGSAGASPSQGGYGGKSNSYNDDIDVTISSTMLSKLLNTELFGTRVTDVILDTLDVNTFTAKNAKFGGLANGTTTIDGKCIRTGYIVDATYNGVNGGITNTAGTVINLENGLFNFGGGKLVYNGNVLSVNGSITATSGMIGGFNVSSTANTGTTSAGGHIGTNSLYTHSVSSNSLYEYEVGMESNTNPESMAIYVGSIDAGDSWSNAEYVFGVKNNGTLVARNADITGNINASSGTIGGFNISTTDNTDTTANGGHVVANSLYVQTSDANYEYEAGMRGSTTGGHSAFYVKRVTPGGSWANSEYTYYVTNKGFLYCTDANIRGNINASSGSIGGFNISSSNNVGTTSNGGHVATDSIYVQSSDNSYEYEAGIKGSTSNGLSAFYVKRIPAGDVWSNSEYTYYVTNKGFLYCTDANIAGHITASSGTIGGFNISSSYNAGTSANGGHFASNSIYVHTTDGNYEYESGIKGNSAPGTSSFYTLRIAKGATWDTGDYIFYVTNKGYLFCSNAHITGSITATTFRANGTDTGTYTTIGDNIRLVNQNSENEPYIAIIDSIGGTTRLDNYMLSLGGARMEYNGGGMEFNKIIEAPSVRSDNYYYLGAETDGYIIAKSTSSNTLLFGVHQDYNSEFGQTHLRGGTIRIYSTASGGGVYLGLSGSTAITSDERFKDVYDIDRRYIDFFNNINPVAYKYKVGHRTHMGFGARAIEAALNKANIPLEEFAGLIIDKDVDIGEDEKLSPDGTTHFDELYSLRYEEFIALNTFMIKRMQKEISDLRQQLSHIQSK